MTSLVNGEAGVGGYTGKADCVGKHQVTTLKKQQHSGDETIAPFIIVQRQETMKAVSRSSF